MYTQSLAFSLPLPPPFTKASPRAPTDAPQRTDTTNQYVIQLTIPSSSSGTAPSSSPTDTQRIGRARSSIIIWAGIGRLNPSHPTPTTKTNGNGNEMNAYEKAMAEEMQDPNEPDTSPQFEGSRNLGQDWACAIPTTLQRTPVVSSTLMDGIEADLSSGSARPARARGMAERLATRFHSQILLSLDIPPAASLLTSHEPSSSAGRSMMGSQGGSGLPGLDPLGDKLYLGLEKALGRVLEGVVRGRV